jgi:hypothetical protein
MEINIVIAAALIVRGDLGSTRVERHSVLCFQIPLLLPLRGQKLGRNGTADLEDISASITQTLAGSQIRKQEAECAEAI